jgi:hypothetical protein
MPSTRVDRIGEGSARRPPTAADAEGGRARREYALAVLAITAASIALFGQHVASAGFYLDDWMMQAQVQRSSPAGIGAVLHDLHSFGPGAYHALNPIAFGVIHLALGGHQRYHLALAVAFGILAASAFYLALRTAGVPRAPAGAAAVLTVAFPWADSARLWASGSLTPLAAAALWAAVALALRAPRHRPAASWYLAVACFALAILLYEITAVAVISFCVVYAILGKGRRALARPAALAAVTAGCLLVVRATVATSASDRSEWAGRATSLGDDLLSLLARAAWPWTAPRGVVLGGLAVVVAAALWRQRRLPPADPARDACRRWLLCALAGVAIAIAGILPLVPARTEYPLLALGPSNRVNLLASFGFSLLLVAIAVLVGRLVGDAVRRPRGPVAASVAAALLLVPAVAWSRDTHVDARDWDHAYALQQQALRGMKAALPSVPPQTTIYTYGHLLTTARGAPVIAWKFDELGMVQLTYHDPTLTGYPLMPGTSLRCATDFWPEQEQVLYGRDVAAAYGRAVVVDTASRQATWIRSRADCERLRDTLPPEIVRH